MPVVVTLKMDGQVQVTEDRDVGIQRPGKSITCSIPTVWSYRESGQT